MHELKSKQKLRRTLYSPAVLVFMFLLTLYMAKEVWGVFRKQMESASRREQVTEKIVELTQREQELRDEMARLSTEQGVNEEIKSKFNVSQEGEYVAMIVDPKPSVVESATSSPVWYKRLWSAILGR